MSETLDNVLKQLGRWGEVVVDKSGFYFKKAVDKGEEFSKIGKIQFEIEKIKRDINHKYTELGRYIVQSFNNSGTADYSNDANYKTLVEDVKKLQSKLDEKYLEKTNIRREGTAEEESDEEEQDVPIGI